MNDLQTAIERISRIGKPRYETPGVMSGEIKQLKQTTTNVLERSRARGKALRTSSDDHKAVLELEKIAGNK